MKSWNKRFLAFLMLLAMATLTGCWDNKETNNLFIVTGVGVDKAESDGAVKVSLQIAKPKKQNKDGKSDSEKPYILIENSAESILNATEKMRMQSSRLLYFQHNEIFIFGKEKAMAGLKHEVDSFLRDEEYRLEGMVFIAEGIAKDMLDVKPDQEDVSGNTLLHIQDEMQTLSKNYGITLMEFASKLLDKTSSPLVPIVELRKEGETGKFSINKMAIFKEDKMVGEMDSEQMQGYAWMKGDYNDGTLNLQTEKGKAVLNIAASSRKMTPILQAQDQIAIKLTVDANLNVEEMYGFEDMSLIQVHDFLIQASEAQIEKLIRESFQTSQMYQSDFYDIGSAVHRRYPKEWKQMEDKWDTIYPTIALYTYVHVEISSVGATGDTYEMREKKP